MLARLLKIRKPRNVDVYDMTDMQYLRYVASKILRGQRPRPMKINSKGDHKIIWSAKKDKQL